MTIPGEIVTLLESGKRKILFLQVLGVSALGLFGPGLLLLLLVLPLPPGLNRIPGLVIAEILSALFAAALAETLHLFTTYRQIDRLLEEDSTRFHLVELDLRPFRMVVLPKVRIYLDAKRNARYVMDLDSARRVIAHFEQAQIPTKQSG